MHLDITRKVVPPLPLGDLLAADLIRYPCDFGGLKWNAICQLACDSREIASSGETGGVPLFFAVRGANFDGHAFIGEVLKKSPSAIVVSEDDISDRAVRSIRVFDIRRTMAAVAKKFFGKPDEELRTVAVTGTDGKTTVAYLCRAMLSGCVKTGMFGTVEYDSGGAKVSAANTTPGAIGLFSMLSDALRNGCRAVALEISSHAIEQKRAHGLNVDAAVFTNLSREHLDFHGTVEAYFASKRKLFDGTNGSRPAVSIVNVDDEYGLKLGNFLRAQGQRVSSYGFSNGADFHLCDVVKNDTSGAEFSLSAGGKRYRFSSSIFGEHNLLNIAAAFAACMTIFNCGEIFTAAVAEFPGVPGRLERVILPNGAVAFIDYAHTPCALAAAIAALEKPKCGRLLVVFGCPGMRDRSKRAPMVKIANEVADFAIATSDDTHGEPLENIFSDMARGITDGTTIAFIADRRSAIAEAIGMSRAGDTILIAGKGHEMRQNFGTYTVDFNDKSVVEELSLSL
jgi:UDP-N-acetylmuramoyl-L-alanyl-D-glutamate--2,6-diaminopimelate ligase